MKSVMKLVAIGVELLGGWTAMAVPILTLTEREGQYIDWSWSDGTGAGTFNSTANGIWSAIDFAFPASATGDFFSQWEENFPNLGTQRNWVYIAPKLVSNVPVPGVAVFNAMSDVPYNGGTLWSLGTAVDSTDHSYQVIFNDGPDHVDHVADAGSSIWMGAASLGLLVLYRRRSAVAR